MVWMLPKARPSSATLTTTQQDDGHDQRELHEALAALPLAPAHSVGSMRKMLRCSKSQPPLRGPPPLPTRSGRARR